MRPGERGAVEVGPLGARAVDAVAAGAEPFKELLSFVEFALRSQWDCQQHKCDPGLVHFALLSTATEFTFPRPAEAPRVFTGRPPAKCVDSAGRADYPRALRQRHDFGKLEYLSIVCQLKT